MIYMDDAIRATIELMDAPKENITIRSSYNLAGMSFNPNQLFLMIRNTYPEFKINYKPDFRQQIADTWPSSIDDSSAANDWGWKPKYDLEAMTESMIKNLKLKQ
jgi:nucleoside-diphosphate-sugar epimerase